MPSTSASVAPSRSLSPSSAVSTFGLFAFVVVAWSLNWVVIKVAIREITPLWAVAIRTVLATLVLFPALLATGQLVRPMRADLPVVFVIALFHMVGFAALMTAGMTFVPASRAVVLGYTTPLWVAPAAFLFLGERITIRQAVGIAIGLSGLLFLLGPHGLDWGSPTAIYGNGLLLLAALTWSVSLVFTRGHRWTATPLQLMPWQCLLASLVLIGLALLVDGVPPTRMSAPVLVGLAYNGVIGTALGFWAMTVVSRRLPAAMASLGLLATPVLGIGLSAVFLGEGLDPVLILSALVILAGVALGIVI